MRRLLGRRKRPVALSLMLAIAALIVTLAGWKWIEPTAQGRKQTAAAGITIAGTTARVSALAEVEPAPEKIGVRDKNDTGFDKIWTTSYDKLYIVGEEHNVVS